MVWDFRTAMEIAKRDVESAEDAMFDAHSKLCASSRDLFEKKKAKNEQEKLYFASLCDVEQARDKHKERCRDFIFPH